MDAGRTGGGQTGSADPGRGRLGGLRPFGSQLRALLSCFGIVGLNLAVVFILSRETLADYSGYDVLGPYGLGLLVFVVAVTVLGYYTGRGRLGGRLLGGYAGVVMGGSAFLLVVAMTKGGSVVWWGAGTGPAVVLPALTAAPFFAIAGRLGRARGRPRRTPGDYPCINCGLNLGPSLAVIYGGRPCPFCGSTWEADDDAVHG